MCENGSEYTDTVDPRVHVELERLNNATDEINKLEVELDETRNNFRQLLCDSTARVEAMRAKLGICVERARPYYEARFCANEALKQTHVAAMRFERANSSHSAAREMVYLAEQGLGGRTLDPAWQEMLNHATQRVNDAETERSVAGGEHRVACMKHEAANVKVQRLQKELKRAIGKSRPYYEMKAHFNILLEHQKTKVQHYESQVAASKLTYSEALRSLEQISDEIHQTRRKASLLHASLTATPNKQTSIDSSESLLEDAQEFVNDEYKSLPPALGGPASPVLPHLEEVEGYRNVRALGGGDSPPESGRSIAQSHSSEWTEINLDGSSPEEEAAPGARLDGVGDQEGRHHRLTRQKTLPNPKTDGDFGSFKSKIKLDASISNWISRSSARSDQDTPNSSRRQSLDNILRPTGEKVKEIFSQGMMMLNINSLTERRDSSDSKDDKSRNNAKKIPSPLEKTMTYLTAEEDNSDTESLSSVDMLNEEQIDSLMLEKDLGSVCEQVLGTPLSEVVQFAQCTSHSLNNK